MRELRSNKRKGAKVSISSVVTEMTQFSEEVFILIQLMLKNVAVVDTLWSDVHVAHYLCHFLRWRRAFLCMYQAQSSIGWDQITATKSGIIFFHIFDRFCVLDLWEMAVSIKVHKLLKLKIIIVKVGEPVFARPPPRRSVSRTSTMYVHQCFFMFIHIYLCTPMFIH